jgi:hypothetical protein
MSASSWLSLSMNLLIVFVIGAASMMLNLLIRQEYGVGLGEGQNRADNQNPQLCYKPVIVACPLFLLLTLRK